MGLLKNVIMVSAVAGITFFTVTAIDLLEVDKNQDSKKKIIEYLRSTGIKKSILSIDNESFKELLKCRYDRLCYNLCVYYDDGQEQTYIDEIDSILHEIEIYRMGKKINLVF